MKIFNLPDLGEGLPNAIIREWHVNVGDAVKRDETIASLETAKALVEVPAPFDGIVEKLFGDVDDTIETGQPLIGFKAERPTTAAHDTGTVVGTLEQSDALLDESPEGIAPSSLAQSPALRTTPAVRALAKRLGVDLAQLTPKGHRITADEVRQAATAVTTAAAKSPVKAGMEKLSLVRQAMSMNMTKSHQQIVPVTLSDEVDISSWHGKENITLRIIRALQAACKAEPILNATFDSNNQSFCYNKVTHLGLAIDTPHGLYSPVLKDIAAMSDSTLRETINRLKQQALDKTIAQEDLHGATIMLSNFGTIAGRFANPIIIPPMTAIVGIGKLHDAVIPIDGKVVIRPVLPISITADHRIVTGGEIARFLREMMKALS